MFIVSWLIFLKWLISSIVSIVFLFRKTKHQKIRHHTAIFYSHSIVAGGLLLMSYTTLLIPLTLLMISLEIAAKNS